MKACSPALAAHLAQGQTTLTTCLKVTRLDGTVMGFTELDQDVIFNGVTYVSAAGFSRFNLRDKQNLEDTTIQLDAMFDPTILLRSDVVARRYDYAAVQVFLVNWASLGMGSMILFTGRFGTATIKEYGFSIELRNMSYQTSYTGGELCSPSCRVDLGSPRCGVSIGGLATGGSVGSTDGFKTIGTGLPSNFDGGLLTWTSGLNAGLSNEINSTVGGTTTLKLETFSQINGGDSFTATPGCDKLFSTCVNVYMNGINFQGEPDVPGPDHLLNYPDFKPPHT